MPRYPFRCETCGLAFEVSRPMSEAGGDAQCPADGAQAVRVFTVPAMKFNRPESPPGPARSSTYSHHGHTHGAGTSHHSHGPAKGPSARPTQ